MPGTLHRIFPASCFEHGGSQIVRLPITLSAMVDPAQESLPATVRAARHGSGHVQALEERYSGSEKNQYNPPTIKQPSLTHPMET